MKELVVLFSFLSFFQHLPAQPVGKLWAYSQVFMPGIVIQRQFTDENGKQTVIPASKSNTSYYIYVAAAGNAKWQPQQLWINGKCFEIKTSSIVTTPVIIEQPLKQQLVAKTSATVTMLEPGEEKKTGNEGLAIKKTVQQNSLVLVYTCKGKKFYKSLKKISELPPVLAE